MTLRAPSIVLFAAVLACGVALAQNDFPRGFLGAVEASPDTGHVGETVTITGRDFEAGEELELVWETYDLAWDLGRDDDGRYDGTFRGLTRSPLERPLDTVTTDAEGGFRYELALPSDFGGPHNVLVRQDGDNVNRVGVEIRPELRIEPERGPPGTDIAVTVTGLNSGQPMVWYQLAYDHAITGFLSAVTTRGTARAVIPATGRPGPHLIQLEDSPFGQPYLPLETSPWDFLEVEPRIFTVTDEPFVQPPDVADQLRPPRAGTAPDGDGPRIWSDPRAAPVFHDATLHGEGFEPGTSVELQITNMEGSRVTESGFAPRILPFGTVEVDAAGTFELAYEMPDMLGGDHRILAKVAGAEETLAEADIQILRYAFPLEKTQFTFGEDILFHLKGIGWTQTENIFAVVVDNVYIGYACGFSTNGDVELRLETSFDPGWHVVDLYPSFYRNNAYSEVDETPFLFRHAMLGWEDHPSGFHVRYAFEVVDASSDASAEAR